VFIHLFDRAQRRVQGTSSPLRCRCTGGGEEEAAERVHPVAMPLEGRSADHHGPRRERGSEFVDDGHPPLGVTPGQIRASNKTGWR